MGLFKLRNTVGGERVSDFLKESDTMLLVLQGGGGCQISSKKMLRNTLMARMKTKMTKYLRNI